MLTLPQFIHGQTDADVTRIFARAGIQVREGVLYDATSGKVVEIWKGRERLDWRENEDFCEGK